MEGFFFHGIDPATKGDYYADVVHFLPLKPNARKSNYDPYSWRPFMVDIMRLRKRPPMQIVDLQIKQFNKFPPTRAVIDSSREDFLSAALVKRYGPTTVLPVKFGNVGTVNTKFKLKQIGYAYINAGYEWPDTNKLQSRFPRYAKLIKILKKEMMREIVTFTDTDRVTSKHPLGKHNDLVHGWEMSLQAVMEYQAPLLGVQKMEPTNEEFNETMQKIHEEEPEDDEYDVPVYDRVGSSSAFSLK